MAFNSKGLHHYHKRKRKNHSNKFKKFLDKLIYVVGVVGPLTTLPQMLKIFIEKSAAGVSLISWIGYMICAIIGLIYGIVHKEKPIILVYIGWILTEVGVIVGTLMYG